MSDPTLFVGLDVHKDTISVAVAEPGRDLARGIGTLPNDGVRLLKRLKKFGPLEDLHCCYEAGPTGYGLVRYLQSSGITCQVVAPSLTPDRQGDRVKTDKRDAIKLAHYLRSGDLTPVWIPGETTEALRDLVRARYDAKIVERAGRHRLSKFLLRHSKIYPGVTAWTGMHLTWIRKQKFEHEPQNRVLCEYLYTVEKATESVARLTVSIEELTVGSSLDPLVQSLQALKGVQLLTAVGVAVELGDLHRFPTARDLMSYIGLGIAEDSSGKQRRRFSITKAGNNNVRRLLVESAWAYRHPPKLGPRLKKRSESLDPKICDIAWKAQHRLHSKYRKLLARKKPSQVAIVAVARELVGFIWAIGQEVDLKAT